MANLSNYHENNGVMLMMETQQRAIGSKTTTTTKTTTTAAASTTTTTTTTTTTEALSNGDTSAREPPSPVIAFGGASFQKHLPATYRHGVDSNEHQQQHCKALQYFPEMNIQEVVVRKSSSSLNLVHEDVAVSNGPATTTSTLAVTAAVRSDGMDGDIWKCGYLRKQKHGHKRFFVLRGPSQSGPSRLEYYDSEKKFRNSLRSAATSSTAIPPKRVIFLYQCFTVNKRADAKSKYLIALYTKDEYFAMVAENEQEQEDWYLALSDLMSEGKKGRLDADELDDGYGTVTPCVVFKEVWQVNVKPKGLGQTKNLMGVYRLCLSTKNIHFVKLNSETPCVNLQLMNIRRCGHSESFFFIEVGRSSSIGPGEIWMQVDDSVVAQNMHETILETMKALKAFAEFRPRSKSQSSGSNPIAFITTRRHLGNLPPSQTGLQRRSRTETVVGTPPSTKGCGGVSFRFRTSSEGEGTMSRPFRSASGSMVHLNSARANLGRQEGSGRYVRALPGSTYHARSASLPVSHFPSATSPVSISSCSDHGSASETVTRPSSASICGSPSDGGFVSSDEYSSSPCDFRYFRVRSNTPDSLGNTPPIREESCLSDYMAMDRHGEVLCGVETSQDKVSEKGFPHKLTYCSRALGSGSVATMYQKMTQTTPSLDQAVSEASSLGSKGQLTCSSPMKAGYSSYSDHCGQARLSPLHADFHRKPKDDGYMPMISGVLPSNKADYMPMQPTSQPVQRVAQPSSQKVDTQEYMVMLPGGNCSPVRACSQSSGNQPKDGEYMDMSQNGVTVPQQTPNENCCADLVPKTKSCSSYFSLPRSYKAPVRENYCEHSEYVPMNSPAKPVYSAADNGFRSPTRDPVPSHGLYNGCSELHLSEKQAVRPTRLSLSWHRESEATESLPLPSLGEYINIEFKERRIYNPCPHSAEDSPSSLGSTGEQRHSPLHETYMTLEADERLPKGHAPRPSLVAPWNPPSYTRCLASASSLGNSSSSSCSSSSGRTDGYTEMVFGLCDKVKSPTIQRHVAERCFPSLPPPSPPMEPKVIRANPQSRRRHSSETFSSSTSSSAGPTSSGSLAPAGPYLTDNPKWQSSSSFDSVWLRMEGVASPDVLPPVISTDVACSPAGRMCRDTSSGYQNGLNYIALDLREDTRAGCDAPSPTSPTPEPPLTLMDSGAYASIDFSEEQIAASKE